MRYPNLPLGDIEDTFNMLGGIEGAARLRRGELVLIEKVKPKILFLVGTFSLSALAKKLSSSCFQLPSWTYRDSDLDTWVVRKEQPASNKATITVVGWTETQTFRELAELLPGVPKELDDVELGQCLIKRGYTVTLTQAEHAATMTEAGKTTRLCKDGWGNFFFTETGDPNNPVAVGRVRRAAAGWGADVSWIDLGYRWDVAPRLFVHNLDPKKL